MVPVFSIIFSASREFPRATFQSLLVQEVRRYGGLGFLLLLQSVDVLNHDKQNERDNQKVQRRCNETAVSEDCTSFLRVNERQPSFNCGAERR